MAALAVLSAAACGASVDSPPKAIEPSTSESRYIEAESSAAFDLADQKALAGWADAVFIGTVAEALGSQDLGVGFPESQFKVSVSETLKGDIPTEVIVNQAGGTDSAGEIVIVDETDLITPGNSYLFSARVFAEKGWLTLANVVGAISLDANNLDGSDIQSRTSEQSLIDRMRDSIANQIPMENEGPRETTLSTPTTTTDRTPASTSSPLPSTETTVLPSSLPLPSESPESVPQPSRETATSTSTATPTSTPAK
ncbi:hypothetical protein [Rhodococcus sp. JT-3]|uniref:hypothetical protein n=1 Tax=Rhodococcus sp. JT-3 TaxID=1973213 RepID=UPI0013038C17|nr:hypothetical protein [Rhodococcus sp. JT-3]